MKRKKIFRIFSFIFFIIIFIISLNVILTSCGFFGGITANRYFMELKSAYSYDAETQILKKFASEIEIDEKNEFLLFDGKSTKPVDYETVNIPLGQTGNTINVTYTVHDDKLSIAEVPVIASTRYHYYMIDGSKDTFLVEDYAGTDIYLVDLTELSATPFMNLGGIISDSEIKLFSVSPDGKYVLYFVKHPDNRGDNIHEFYLCAYDIASQTASELMGFENTADLSRWEFLAWEKDSSGSFLYRDKYIDMYGIERYSNIYRASVRASVSSVSGQLYSHIPKNTFLETDLKYSQFEMVDDEHIFAHSYRSADMLGVLYIKNIYTQEEKVTVLPRYAIIWNISLSDSKDYAALLALYVDMNGHQVTRLVTVYFETNDIRFYYELGYEPGLESYDMHSFYWLPDNILGVNFINIVDLYSDICRFHRVNHTKSNIPKIDIEDTIYKDGLRYIEE